MHKLILSLILLLLASCAHDPPIMEWDDHHITYYVFSGDEKIVERAANEWSKKTGVNLVRVNDVAADIIYRQEQIERKGVLGFCVVGKKPVIIVVEPQKNKIFQYKVTLHEFGHALGLAHWPSELSIMYPSMDLTNYHKRNIGNASIRLVRHYFKLEE